MHTHHKKILSIVGSSALDSSALPHAFEVGRLAVLHNFSIVCGGMRGVMQAACEGAQAAKLERLNSEPGVDLPQVIAILPQADKSSANPFVDIVIPTGMGYTRNALVILAGDGTIALEGGSGTLSEIAFAWQFHKPVAAMVATGGWSARLAGQCLDEKRPNDVVYAAHNAQAAIDYMMEKLSAPRV